MSLVCTNPPLVEPVTLAELKEALRMDPTDPSQDTTLARLNATARAWAETITRRRFVQQTWQMSMDWFPGYIDEKLVGRNVSSPVAAGYSSLLIGIRYAIALVYSPVQSLVSFDFQDANGGTTSMITEPSSFVQDLLSSPARLTPLFGQMWPIARVVINAVQLSYVVGYADPVRVTTISGSAVLATSGYSFTSANVGQVVSIPGAGPSGATLNTVVASVDGGGVPTVRDKAGTAVAAVLGLIVAHDPKSQWDTVKNAIIAHVNLNYVLRLRGGDYDKSLRAIQNSLGPAKA